MNAQEARNLLSKYKAPLPDLLKHLEDNILEAATRGRRLIICSIPAATHEHDLFRSRNSLLERGYSVIIKRQAGILAENLVRFPSITFEVSW